LCGGYRALGRVEAASATHRVGDDHRKDRTADASTNAIQQLQADQPIRVVGYTEGQQLLLWQVYSGGLAARIDDRGFRAAVDQAKADVEAAKAAIVNYPARRGFLFLLKT
jgi:hypothetical protein